MFFFVKYALVFKIILRKLSSKVEHFFHYQIQFSIAYLFASITRIWIQIKNFFMFIYVCSENSRLQAPISNCMLKFYCATDKKIVDTVRFYVENFIVKFCTLLCYGLIFVSFVAIKNVPSTSKSLFSFFIFSFLFVFNLNICVFGIIMIIFSFYNVQNSHLIYITSEIYYNWVSGWRDFELIQSLCYNATVLIKCTVCAAAYIQNIHIVIHTLAPIICAAASA